MPTMGEQLRHDFFWKDDHFYWKLPHSHYYDTATKCQIFSEIWWDCEEWEAKPQDIFSKFVTTVKFDEETG